MLKGARLHDGSESDGIRRAPAPAAKPSLPLDSASQLNLTPDRSKNHPKARGKENAASKLQVKVQKHVTKPISETEDQVEEFSNIPPVTVKFSSLQQPEINSTAMIEKKLQDLHVIKFNAEAALEKEIQQSERLKNVIAEKSSKPLNIKKQDTKYTDLISLEVDSDEIAKAVSQPRMVYKAHRKQDVLGEPDIMQFFSEEFISEAASFKIPVIENEFIKPCYPPAENCLDYYKHMQTWK